MKRRSPSRTPEKRREAYERNIATVKAWEQRRKESPEYARAILAREMGVSIADVPGELIEARFQQILLHRAVRDAQTQRLYPQIRERYLGGETVRDLAAELGMDGARVANVIKSGGIQLHHRPYCKNGHPRTEENTAITPQGWRRCRQCSCESTKRRYHKRKGMEPLDSAGTI